MNLNAIVAPYVAAVNPLLVVTVYPSIGSITKDDGARVPEYDEPYEVKAAVQALSFQDIVHIQGLNLNGTRRAIYLSAPLDGVTRPQQKGGDLITIPNAFDQFSPGSLWLIAYVVEPWIDTGGWNKVVATLQNDQIEPFIPKKLSNL